MSENALVRAAKVGRDAADYGFDWDDASGALDKVAEETSELREAIALGDPADIAEEMGDLLFAVTSVGRLLNLDLNALLHDATTKFQGRFEAMLQLIAADGRRIDEMELAEMEGYWTTVKSPQ